MTHEDKIHRQPGNQQRRNTGNRFADFDVAADFTPDIEQELGILLHLPPVKYNGFSVL